MRRYALTPNKMALWVKDGRGTGEGPEYKSWLRFEDFASKGAMSRFIEGRHRRTCVAFSNVEFELFAYLDACPQVVELYDQYKLDFDETRDIAKDLGIAHPSTDSGMEVPMTSDLYVHVETGAGTTKIPFQCKHSNDLSDFNQAEHMEIERRYWLARGTPLRVVTESNFCIPRIVRDNVKSLVANRFLHESKFAPPLTFTERSQLALNAVLTASKSCSLSELAQALATHTALSVEDFNRQISHLIYRGQLVVDMTLPSLFSHSVLDIKARTLANMQRERQSNAGGQS